MLKYVHKILVCQVAIRSASSSKLEWLASLDEFGFSSMGYSLLLLSEFDHEAYGLSFKTVAM